MRALAFALHKDSSRLADSTMDIANLPAIGASKECKRLSSPKISIIINNFNYGRFLIRAIDSALAQKDDNFEVIVVDDGSTDNSVVLARSRTSPILRVIEKPNGGQASAINVGFLNSTGDWVIFLDSDDWYELDALEKMRIQFRPGIAKIHFPLIKYYETTGTFGEMIPRSVSRGDVVQEVAETGDYRWPPTTGNIFGRDALSKIMPIPEESFKICADVYLCILVAAYGDIAAIERPLGFYCVHGGNAHARATVQLNKKHLYTQSLGLLLVTRVARELLKTKGFTEKMTVLDRRENIEIVALAARFGAIRLEDFGYSWRDVRSHWRKAYRKSPKTLRSRIPARCIWLIVNYAPFPLVRVVMESLASFRSRRFSREVESR
jgi:glycosyltransferase involved in cell wall biosynthesis